MNVKTKLISFILLCFFLFSILFQPLLAQKELVNPISNDKIYEYTIRINDYFIQETELFSLITINEFGFLTDPNKPKLPSKLFSIGLPPDSKVNSVEIIRYQSTTITINKPIETASSIGNGTSTLLSSFKKYDNSSVPSYPEHIISYQGMGSLGPYRFASIRLNPVQRITEKSYRIIENITIGIHYELKEGQQSKIGLSSSIFHKAGAYIENYYEIHSYYESSSFQQDDILADYVIIANDSLYPELIEFKMWKSNHGYSVKIVNLSTIINEYPGIDVACRIRTFLQTHLAKWGITYVLLVGSYKTIPMRHSYPMNYDEKSDSVPTDYYYADLTSDWDEDGDGYYGELEDFIDCTAEVHVGRIPFDNPNDVNQFLTKTMEFENNSAAWKKRVLLPGAFLWFDNYKGHNDTETDGAVLQEILSKDLFQNYDFSTITLYEKEGLKHSDFDCDLALNTTNLIKEWNKGCGIVNWVGHGRIESFERLVWTKDNGDNIPYTSNDTIKTIQLLSNQNDTNNNDVLRLHDTKPALVFSTGCDNAYIDYRYRQSIAESLLQNGAVVFIGATRDLYGPLNWTSLPDGGIKTIDYLFFYSYIKQLESTGVSLDIAKTQYYKNYMGIGDTWWHFQNIFSLTLFGDPSLVVQEAPNEPMIIGPDTVEKDKETWFEFKITDPQQNNVYIQIDWESKNTTPWLGPFESGKQLSLSHEWTDQDNTIVISARAKDEYGWESQWTTKEIKLKEETILEKIIQFLISIIDKWNCPLLEQFLTRIAP